MTLAGAAVCVLAGCSAHQKTDAASGASGADALQTNVAVRPETGSVAMMPKATAFRMSGDYADRVAVTLDADGNLLYYPAVTDITAASAPVEIGDGWWLNRQGIGPNSVFTKWTFAEYRALGKTPSQAEIKAAVIPGALVEAFRQLPLTMSQAANESPASLLKYLK